MTKCARCEKEVASGENFSTFVYRHPLVKYGEFVEGAYENRTGYICQACRPAFKKQMDQQQDCSMSTKEKS